MKVKATAPTRISLAGGGTDLPIYYRKHGGKILNIAINVKQHITLTNYPFMGKETRFSMPEKASERFYQAFFDEMGIDLYLQAEFDAVIESGLGSSASAAVALVAAIAKWQGKKMTKKQIAELAWKVEVKRLKLYGGKQDQYAAAFGGVNVIDFGGTTRIRPLPEDVSEELSRHLLLFHTGLNRTDPKIQEQLKKPTPEQEVALHSVKKMVDDAEKAIRNRDWQALGESISYGWTYKRLSNPKIATENIDNIYRVAMKAAWGGKLCGSGGGGYMLFIADPKKHIDIALKLKELGAEHLAFEIDWEGVQACLV